MKYILNLSLGSSKRDFNACFNMGNEVFNVIRKGMDGDITRFVKEAQNNSFEAIAIGGINASYKFNGKKWPLRQYKLLTSHIKGLIYDGSDVKSYYEPYSLNKILEQCNGIQAKRWLVFSVLDREPCYNLLRKADIVVSIGDVYAGLGIPYFPSRNIFKAGAFLTLPILSRLPVSFFYPHTGERKHGTRVIDVFDVILAETNFLINKNYTSFKDKLIILSRVSQKEKDYFVKRGAERIYPLLPGKILSANIIEAMIGLTIGQRQCSIEERCALIDSIEMIGGIN